MKQLISVISFLLLLFNIFGQSDMVWLQPNRGQWHDNIRYKVDLSGGKMYLESTGFTYHFYENPRENHQANSENHNHSVDKEYIHQHVVRSQFINNNTATQVVEENPSLFYANYFLGSEKSKWKSEVYSYSKLTFKNFYSSTDLVVESGASSLKYSFILAPSAKPSSIRWDIKGADKINIDSKGNLIITTSLGTITESKPLAWNIKNGKKTPVDIRYQLNGSICSFKLGNYTSSDTLIIDPSLTFSTYTGSTSDNWGMTATPGPNGEMFAGGITFGTGYPISTGAFDASYNGGTTNNNIAGFDVTISKFSANGAQLLYSTYLGGSANELPQSMIVNEYGELFVLGITASTNFPMSGTPFQSVFAGGPTATHNALKFVGSDLFLARFNAQGTQLVASTYIGGSNLDGLNTSNLSYNYGDQYRGEIVLYGNDVIIASHSRSVNFPVTNGSSLNGEQDMIALRITGNFSTLVWSGYHGGSNSETGNSLAIGTTGEVFITGGSSSANFVLTNGNTAAFSGDRDGYILKLNAATGATIAGTYLGYSGYDQCYFVRTDIDDKIYVFGQTTSNWPITPGKYGNPNSGQFIRKYSNNLVNIEWTTMIGAGSGKAEISPTAFLVSDCYDIFLSGWGGVVNVQNSQATSSSSNGFPITPDAHQSTTSGSNFYLGILSKDAATLVYGTYMGGFSGSYNHVDGGTSRFDRSGAVYHAVCASCGGASNGFVSTPGAWSTTNNSPNCNLAAFKFQLGTPYSLSPNTSICKGASTQLNATGGTSYTWSPAASLNNPNIPNPIATPSETTVYYVSMNFNAGCAIVDSIIVEVIKEPVIQLAHSANVCLNDTLSITASGGTTYSWSPNIEISSTTTPTVNVWPSVSRFYTVQVSNQCFSKKDSTWVNVLPLPEIILIDDTLICKGSSVVLNPISSMNPVWEPHATLQVHSNGTATATPTTERYYYVKGIDANGCKNRDSVKVNFYPLPNLIISPDTAVCIGTSAQLSISGAQSYTWTPAASLNNPSIANPIATPTTPTTYTVNAVYGNNCVTQKQVKVNLLYLPTPIVPDTVFACYGESRTITIGGATSYQWSPGTYLDTTQGSVVQATVYNDIIYTVNFTNVCGTVTEDIYVKSISPKVEAFNDTIICPGETVQLFAIGSYYYEWSPSAGLNVTNASSVYATPTVPTHYIVSGTDQYGCSMKDTVFVDLFPQPIIKASPDQYLLEGDDALISAETPNQGIISWSPAEYLSCVVCKQTMATPPGNITYYVTLDDINGCKATDSVRLFFDPLVYVPNTFTPDSDEFNPRFKAVVGNIRNFKLMIYNRWGEVVFTSKDPEIGWDGIYKGKMSQDGTYTWKLFYSDMRGNDFQRIGHVNLLR